VELLEQFCADQADGQSIVAIGEIGLDYYRKNHHDRELQQWFFSQQLQIAGKYHLPVLIHARKSHFDVIQYLKEYIKKYPEMTGIIHAYSGSYEQAEEYLKLGFKLGFGGAYTYPEATRLRSLVGRLPIDAWVLETDAPDMSPVGHQGELNSPEYLPEIAGEFVKLYNADRKNPFPKDKFLTQLTMNSAEVLSFN